MVDKVRYACIAMAGYGRTGVCKSKYTVLQHLCSIERYEVKTLPNAAKLAWSDRKMFELASERAKLTSRVSFVCQNIAVN
jgi:hypothetical protein